MAYADYMVDKEKSRTEPNQSTLGKLNASVHAAARTLIDIIKERQNEQRAAEQQWFEERRAQRTEISNQITSIETELKHRTAADLNIIHYIRDTFHLRSTKLLQRQLAQLKDRLLVIEARISVREQEIVRKNPRLRFKREPSLKWLERTRSGHEDEEKAHPPMESATQYCKGITGTRRPSLRETIRWYEEMA